MYNVEEVIAMKYTNFLLRITLLYLAFALASMGCSSNSPAPTNSNPNPPSNGVPPTGLTTFSGGTLADLQALSPTLTFDELEITGGLDLPLKSSTTITANKLTITSTGSIFSSYNICTYAASPNLTLSVSGDVVIDGLIAVEGRDGVVVYSLNPSCDSCFGQNGGNVAITGSTIRGKGKILNGGGNGSISSTSSYGSIRCEAGDSGSLTLKAATTMDLSGATINNVAGQQNLDPSKNGSSGTVNIGAGDTFIMRGGNIDSTGVMTFSAASTDIWGTILYGSLTETIGGATDTTNPIIGLHSRPAAATYGETIQVFVQASDVGMGLRSVRLIGLGSDQTYNIADCGPGSTMCTVSALNSTLTMTFPVSSLTSPASLQMIAIDNEGNTTTATLATGIVVKAPLETEPNDSLAQAQELKLGGMFDGTIQNDDLGYIWPPGTQPVNLGANSRSQYKIEDFYKVKCCNIWNATPGYNCFGNTDTVNLWVCYGIQISLDFTGSASITPNLDVYLLNAYGASVDDAYSIKNNVATSDYTESFTYLTDWQLAQYKDPSVALQMNQTFYVGVQAKEVPTRAMYRIKYGP
jgi:hypothetical protein